MPLPFLLPTPPKNLQTGVPHHTAASRSMPRTPIPSSPRAPRRVSSANSPYDRARSGGEAAQAPQPSGRAQSGVPRQIGFSDGHAVVDDFAAATRAARHAARVAAQATAAEAAEPPRRAAPRAQPQPQRQRAAPVRTAAAPARTAPAPARTAAVSARAFREPAPANLPRPPCCSRRALPSLEPRPTTVIGRVVRAGRAEGLTRAKPNPDH